MRASGRIDPLDRAVGDVALVPQGHVLEAGAEVAPQHAGPGRRAARPSSGCACGAWPSCPSGRPGTAPRPRAPRCAAGGGSRWRSARAVAPTDAQAYRYSAWRSRATTWVAGTGVSPSAAHTWPRPRGRCWSRCRPRPRACPPPPPRAPGAAARGPGRPAGTRGRAWRRRWWARRARRGCGPTIGVSRNSRARALSTATSRRRRAIRRSAASVSVQQRRCRPRRAT